jgi:hypothetical protein
MTVLRVDIERALDELIGYEDGLRFQALGVILAKQKWPDLVAREPKRDEGLDAYAPASLALNGIGKGLACSTTATLTKVRSDAEKVREHFKDVSVLIFATPGRVTGTKATEWANSIKQAYDLDLIVMSREDIVTQLMLPSNAPLLRSQLRITVPIEAEIAEVQARAQEAAAEVISSWLNHPRLAGRPRMSLQVIRLDQHGQDTEITLDQQDLRRELLAASRIVLEAPAGRGKTTTLLQLAEGLTTDALPLLVDLPAWLASTGDVLEFIARSQPFRSRGVDALLLARLLDSISGVFLLNGWNEVSDDNANRAQSALAQLEREFPSTGIIVATRTHFIRPPLPGSFRARIPPLTRSQRAGYLQQALGSRANELRVFIDRDPVLDDLTRTPLILAEVTSIILSGQAIPNTKMGVLGAAFQLAEQGEEHHGYLGSAPLHGRGRDYLAALALKMTSTGAVAMNETDARSVVHSLSTALNAAGQISTVPQPAAILGTLTAHHLLERVDYPVVAFRFEHQQFQEYLAAAELGKRLTELVRTGDPNLTHEFALTYIDLPAWEEPLRMIAEEIGSQDGEARNEAETVAAGVSLIQMTLVIDPVFAAELSRLCGNTVWERVGRNVGVVLREWRQVANEHHERCALAGMIATGSDDFADILVPLLTNDDSQVRLGAYRAWRELHVSSLGRDWRGVVRSWKEESRIDFVTQLRHQGTTAAILQEFAASDPSLTVREVALQSLSWLGETDVVTQIVTKLNEEEFAQMLSRGVLLEIPNDVKARALKVYEHLLDRAADPGFRIRTRLRLHELGGEEIFQALRKDLDNFPPGSASHSDEEVLRSALEVLDRTDPSWVSGWVAERIVNGSLWPERWIRFVSTLSEAFRDELLNKLSSQERSYPDEHRIIAVLAAVSDANFIGRVFSRMLKLRTDIQSGAAEDGHADWAIVRQLRDLIRQASQDVSVAGILGDLSATPDLVEYEAVTDVLSPEGGDEGYLRDELPEHVRQSLRRYLKQGISLVLAQDDFAGGLKAHAAMTLAVVGEREDISDLETLINADIHRVRIGQAARIKGERSEAANGAAMRWSNWYVRALFWLDSASAERILLRLLSEAEYEVDAAQALVKLAGMETSSRKLGVESTSYADLWDARGGKLPASADDGRRRRYAAAIKQRISEIRRDDSPQMASSTENSEIFNMRLKRLATTVATLDGRDSVDLVMEILQLPGHWDNWIKADALEMLLFRGARLPAEAALRILNPAIESLKGQMHDQQAAYVMRRFLSLLPFIEPCRIGIGRLREIIAAIRLGSHDLRPIMTALGHSRCSDAVQLLVDMALNSGSNFSVFEVQWIDAVAAAGGPESELVLLGLVDPAIGSKVLELRLDHYHQERLAQHIAEIAGRDSAVRARLFALCSIPLQPQSRAILARVIAEIQTEEAVIAGLELIDDQATPSIPYGISKGLENFVLERRPFEGSTSSYSLESRNASDVRARLFALLIQHANSSRSAWGLLGQIESWRLDYGRPGGEPRHPAIESGKPWPPLEDSKSFAA